MPAITIERIEAIALRIPMDHWAPPPLFAGRPRTTIDTLLVRVTTNRDVVGWGEAYGGGWQATVAALEQTPDLAGGMPPSLYGDRRQLRVRLPRPVVGGSQVADRGVPSG